MSDQPLDIDAMFDDIDPEPTDLPKVATSYDRPTSTQYANPVTLVTQETTDEPRQQSSSNWLTIVGFCLAAFFAALWWAGRERSDDDRRDDDDRQTISVTVDKPTVLITYGDRDNPSTGQAGVLTTTKVQTWCEDNDIDYRRLNIDTDMVQMEPKWQEMIKLDQSTPAIHVAVPGGYVASAPLPDSIDATISRIKEEVDE